MDYSVFHFFSYLVQNRGKLQSVKKLDNFNFNKDMLSYRSSGRFPDMAIKLSRCDSDFTGGELIELKDSDGLTIASFNSTIPSGKKDIRLLTQGKSNMRVLINNGVILNEVKNLLYNQGVRKIRKTLHCVQGDMLIS